MRNVGYPHLLSRYYFRIRSSQHMRRMRLALVCIMQFMENLSDRQAADAVHKYSSNKDGLNSGCISKLGNCKNQILRS
jgi:hypothetical protein